MIEFTSFNARENRTESTSMTQRLRRMMTKMKLTPIHPKGGERGFTAIEIAMVATVIAILALIVLPLFRNRVEEAKIAAAKADLRSFQKALTLAHADTGYWFRLEDLDNIEGNPYNAPNNPAQPPPAGGIVLETPPMVFYADYPASSRRPLDLTEWQNLSGSKAVPKWRGPYTSFQRAIELKEVVGGRTVLPPTLAVRSEMGGHAQQLRAPIWNVAVDNRQHNQVYDSDDNLIPIDPWGNPYLFFPPSGETLYTNAVIYSMGPNGVPGDGQSPGSTNPNVYLRPDPNSGIDKEQFLGGGDDLMVQF